MDATTDQIKREIEEARERISETTSQIGERIRATFDWRQQVAEHPWAAVGIATGAGFVIGAAIARGFGGASRAASSYGEQYTYDRIARDVEAQAPSGDGGEWLRGPRSTAAATSEEWHAPRDSAFSPEAASGGRGSRGWREPEAGVGRAGAMTGLIASIGAAIEPQLKEIGRTLAEQLKDLSNHLIGQGKEAMKQRVDQWRQGGSEQQSGGQRGSSSPSAASPGGSPLSSESAGAWPSDRQTAAGTAYGTSTSPGMQDARETRTPDSRESASAERRARGGV